MKRTWIILIISILVWAIAFIFFVFPGFYFTYESKKAASTPTGIPPTSASVPPTYSTGGPTPPPSGSSYPIKSGSSAPSGSASGSFGPSSSISGSSSSSPSQSNGGGVLDKLYDEEKREEEILTLSSSIAKPVIGAALAAILLSFLFNFPFRDIFYLLFSFFGLFRKKRRPWGVVYESISKKPIKGVVVKIVESSTGRVKEMKITDDEGRFGFLVEKGIYKLQVSKNGFIFPSRKITLNEKRSDGYYPKVYLGGDIKVEDEFLGVNIPMDMIASTPSRGYILFLRIARFFERIRLPLLIIGTILALLNLFLFRSFVDFIIVILYILLWLFEILQLRKIKPFGEVKDNSGPLGLTVIRFFKEKNSKLISTSISDSHGRFYVLLPSGNYYLTAMKGGYLPYKSETISISKIKLAPEIKVMMKKS